MIEQISIQLLIIEEKQKQNIETYHTKLKKMSLLRPLQPNTGQTKQWILSWFSLSREQKRSFNWEQKNIVLYPLLIPLLYDDINLDQLLISHLDINDKFNKFFSSTFKMKLVTSNADDVYNLNQIFVFNLETEVNVREVIKRNGKIQETRRKFSTIVGNNVLGAWRRLDHANNLVQLSIRRQGESARVLCADKGLMGRFKIEILKQDYEIKSNFINQFLFCGTSPSYSVGCLTVEKLKRHQPVKGLDEKMYVMFEGSAIHEINSKNSSKNSKILGQKWKFELVRGSLIFKDSLKSTLTSNISKPAPTSYPQDQYLHNYYLLTDSVFIAISYTDLNKIIKSQKNTKKNLFERIKQTQETHNQFIRKSLNVEQKIRQEQTRPIQYHYPIPRNQKSKAFRKKTEVNQNNYEEFITFDRFEVMTQNKENVEKRHEVYAQLSNFLRQKQKQERFMKKMTTEKGMKEFKKCSYQARLKQNKIEVLAIKESIFNAEKFRDRPHQVKFIFEEEMMDKYLKNEAESKNTGKRHQKKFSSLVDFSNEDIESKVFKSQQKSSQFNQDAKGFKSNQNSRFMNGSTKMVFCESTPNIAEKFLPGKRKLKRIGSAIPFQQQGSRFA